jgi:hypothetical protein
MTAKRFCLLYYKIPSTVRLNPAPLLHRFAASIDGSVWFMPTSNLALIPVKDWLEKGAAVVEVFEFDESQNEKVIANARRAISENVDGMRSFVEKLVGNVRTRYAKAKGLATGSQEQLDAFKEADQYAYASLYRAKGVADAAEECALHFDITGDVAALVDGLRKSIKAKSALFFSMKNERSTETTMALGTLNGGQQ